MIESKIKLTLWAGEKFFGPGICELLEGIRDTGSIQAAAARMEMSYTKAWRILNRAEAAMGVRLIARMSGGKKGGSSTLTGAGETAVHDFRAMEAKLNAMAGELLRACERSFAPNQEGSDAL